MLNVRYIGNKPEESGRKGGVNLTWVGKGAVHAVTEKQWSDYLCKHPDVWELVIAEGGLSDAKPAEPKHITDMNDAELRAHARAAGIKVDGRLKGERLRAAILDAEGSVT